jgi:uncharacterized damage-inducible protein DinB
MSDLSNSVPAPAADKQKLLDLLRASRQRFLASFAGVTDEESRRHPAPGQWSVLDTVEHLTAAEKLMLKLLTESRRPRAATTPDREEIFLRAPNRTRKLESPETGLPRGRFANLDEARTHFETAREAVLKFVEQCDEDLRATEVTHPHPAAGVVTACEMVIIMARHSERHAMQIEEIRNYLVNG